MDELYSVDNNGMLYEANHTMQHNLKEEGNLALHTGALG